jgi:integrase
LSKPLEPILKFSRQKVVAVLTPSQYSAVRDYGDKGRMDGLLYTGMRYVEAQRFHDNPDWFKKERGQIHLPTTSVFKGKRRMLDRWIRLNTPGVLAVEMYLQGKRLPSDDAWLKDMRAWGSKAGLETKGFGPKTLRKTWESWLTVWYPDRALQIAQCQGHTSSTGLQYYMNLPFTDSEKEEMRPYVSGVF